MVIKWTDKADDSFRYGMWRWDARKVIVEICWPKWKKLSKREAAFFRNELLDDKFVRDLYGRF